MRTSLFILAGVTALAFTAPAGAQVYLDGPGVDVRIGGGPDRHHPRTYRGYDRSYARGDCREVRTKTIRPSGRVVYTTKRICD
jgi:hypothetical protein